MAENLGEGQQAAVKESPKAKQKGKSGKAKKANLFVRMFQKGRWIALLMLIGFVALRVVDPYPVQFLRVKIFDIYQQMKPREVSIRPVTIIDLDEKSLAEIGQWPWPRTVLAQMVSNLMQMGAGLVAFDVVFAEPDRLNPQNIAESLVGLDEEMQGKLRKLPSNDEVFGQIIRKSRVVLGQANYWDDLPEKDDPPVRQSVAVRKLSKAARNPQDFLPPVISMIRNVPELEKNASGHGFFSLAPEPDGVVRRVPTFFNYQGKLFPSLSLEMLRVATNRRTVLVRTNEAGVDSVAIAKGLDIKTDEKGRVWPYFSKTDKKKYVSARDVLAGTVDPALIKGKLTIVGTSAVGLLDIRSTPVDRIIPGVEVHAQMIETILKKEFLARPNHFLGMEIVGLIVVGILMIWLVPVVGAKWTLGLFLVAAGGAAGSSWYMFTEQQLLLDVGFGIIVVLLLYTTLTYSGYASEEAQRRQVRSAFSQYLSPALVEQLAEDPTQLTLGGEMRDMTLLFCDVRGFTTISESFGDDAQGLTNLINTFLTPMTDVILARKGTIDKYMGDCIMAFWNAPLPDEEHAKNACRSALAMMDAVHGVNDRLEAEAKEQGRRHVPIRVGIGLNSGECCVGNMGSEQRFDYSVLGDNVNLASRLEGQSKGYAVDVVIGENTNKDVEGFATLELDLIKVKGKTEAVRIFTLQGLEELNQSSAFQTLKETHNKMLAAYRGQKWGEARDLLAACRQQGEAAGLKLDGFYDLYAGRIEEYAANPPGEDWDGVFVATTK